MALSWARDRNLEDILLQGEYDYGGSPVDSRDESITQQSTVCNMF